MNTNQDNLPVSINVDDLAKKKVQEIEDAVGDGIAKNGESKELTSWLAILKQIITAADLHRTNDGQNVTKNEIGESIYADFSDDNEQFTSQVDLSEQFATNSVKWTIRVKAFKLVHRLVQLTINHGNDSQLLALPNTTQKLPRILITQLPDLVRLSFVAATSPYDELKLQGFEMFRVLIDKFASHEDSEFPSHSILEQYKTQFLSAVKPAFNQDSPPYITAIASRICSSWICQGLEKDSIDIQRTYQLMLMSIEKFEGQCMNQHSKLYTECELEQERLDILGAWAQLYISSRESDIPDQQSKLSRLSKVDCERLKSLVDPQIETLVDKWWDAMKDYALLIMPSPKFLGTSHDNDNVYTREVALKLFAPTWPKLVLALSIWLCNHQGGSLDPDSPVSDSPKTNGDFPKRSNYKASGSKYCKFLFGIIMKELCRCLVNQPDSKDAMTQSNIMALRSLNILISDKSMRNVPLNNLAMAQEFYCILYHITIHHARDPNKLLLRQILDQFYDLIVDKVSKKDANVKYGLSKVLDLLMSAMKEVEIASRQKSTADLDIQRTHLSILLRNLLGLIRSAPEIFKDEVPLQVALTVVIRELICFDDDPMVSLTSADKLKDILPLIEDLAVRVHILDELYPTLCDRVCGLICSLFSSDKYLDKDKLNLSRVDSLLKSMRLMLDSIDNENRKGNVEAYIQSTLKSLDAHGSDPDKWISGESRKKRELIDFLVNQNLAIRRMYPDVDITPKVQQILDSATQLQRDIKASIETKNQKSNNVQKPLSSRPQVAKISLKADFSNFYGNKR